MNTNVREVSFGTKQEAVITPKEGYEVKSVTVVNTADGQIVPSEIKKTSDNPAQWVCTFVQPAGHVSIKADIRPILYSVTIEENDMCKIVLVEQNSEADVKIQTSVSAAEGPGESTDFNNPQHSVNVDAESALDVEEENVPSEYNSDEEGETNLATEDIAEDEHIETPSLEDLSAEDILTNNESEDSSEQNVNDISYDAGKYEKDLEDVEPVVMTREEFDRKCNLFWQYKERYDSGKITKDEFENVFEKHNQMMDDVQEGKIIVQ